MKGNPADSNAKLAGAKHALKDKLMQAVLQQAIQELGTPQSIADSLIDQAANSPEFQNATQSLVQRVIAEIETRSIDSISKSSEASDSIFDNIKNESTVVPDAVGHIRTKLIEDIHARSIEKIADAESFSAEAYSSFDSNRAEITEATARLRSQILDDITSRAAESVSDFDAVARELVDNLGSQTSIVDPVVEQLRSLLIERIENRAIDALKDADGVATSIAQTVKEDNEVITQAADAVRTTLLNSVENRAIESIKDSGAVSNEIQARFEGTPEEVSRAVDALHNDLISQISQSGLDSISDSTETAAKARNTISDDDSRITAVQNELTARLLEDVTNSAIEELADQVGGVDTGSLPNLINFVGDDEPSFTEEALDSVDTVVGPIETTPTSNIESVQPVKTESVEDFSDQKWENDESSFDISDTVELTDEETDSLVSVLDQDGHQAKIDQEQNVEHTESTFEEEVIDLPVSSIDEPESDHKSLQEVAFTPVSTDTDSHNESADSAFYVYGIVSQANMPSESELPTAGIDPERPVELVGYGELRAAVTRVSLSEFSGETFKARLQDKGWLKEKVRLHSQVLDSLNTGRTIIPMRFCTVYRNEDEVSQILSAHGDHYSNVLGKIDGKQEWSVRIYRDEQKLAEKVADSDRVVETSLDSISKGVVHFVKEEMNRLHNVNGVQAIELMSQHCSSRSHAALMECAADGIFKPSLTENGDNKTDVVLNAAYLVPKGQEDKLRDEVERLGSEYSELGFRYEVHGPWPPYHFVGEPAKKQSAVSA